MNKIEFLSTGQLLKLATEFEFPKKLSESMILRGVLAELASRTRSGEPNDGRDAVEMPIAEGEAKSIELEARIIACIAA